MGLLAKSARAKLRHCVVCERVIGPGASYATLSGDHCSLRCLVAGATPRTPPTRDNALTKTPGIQ